MARQKPADKVTALEKRQADLATMLKEARTKAAAEAREAQRRKNELAGAVVLKELEAHPSGEFATALTALLHAGLTRPADRAELGLAALPKPGKDHAAADRPGRKATAGTDSRKKAAAADDPARAAAST